MDLRLDGKVAVITGGGGGFGQAFALEMARSGAAVALVDNRLESAEHVAAQVREEGGNAEAYAADVSKTAEVEQTVKSVVDSFGGLDILVNAAATGGNFNLKDLAEEEWDRILDLNLKGTYLCCKAAIPHMEARGEGRIMNFASLLGVRNRPVPLAVGNAHYVASKGGVIAFSRALAQELVPSRITVNAFAPGATDTGLWRRDMPPEVQEAKRNSNTVGLPEDLAPLAVLLASDRGYYLTGNLFTRDDFFMPRRNAP